MSDMERRAAEEAARLRSAAQALGHDVAELSGILLQSAPDTVLLVDPDGVIVFANERASETLGYAHIDLVGLTVEDLVPDALQGRHLAHRTRYRAEPTIRSMGQSIELLAVRDDGHEVPVEISLSPLHASDGTTWTIAVLRDVTERRSSMHHEREVRRLLDATDDALFVFEAASLRITHANRGMERQTGYSADELHGMTPLHVNPMLRADQMKSLVGRLTSGERRIERLRTVHRDRDGRDHEVEIVLQCPSLDDEDGAGHLIVAVARDISEQLTTERRILEAERELSLLDDRERIARDLHDTVIQKLFASGMALQATLMTAQGPLRDKLEQCVEDLDDAIRDLRTAIFGLRGDAVNADAPQARLLRIAAEESVVLGFHPQVAFVGAVDQLDGVLTADLEAVLRELLSNVGRHAAATRVEVTIEVDDEVRLTVHDNGNGVDKIAPIGNGRRSLAERATMRGGQFRLAPSAHSSGTIATWVVQRPEEGDS